MFTSVVALYEHKMGEKLVWQATPWGAAQAAPFFTSPQNIPFLIPLFTLAIICQNEHGIAL